MTTSKEGNDLAHSGPTSGHNRQELLAAGPVIQSSGMKWPYPDRAPRPFVARISLDGRFIMSTYRLAQPMARRWTVSRRARSQPASCSSCGRRTRYVKEPLHSSTGCGNGNRFSRGVDGRLDRRTAVTACCLSPPLPHYRYHLQQPCGRQFPKWYLCRPRYRDPMVPRPRPSNILPGWQIRGVPSAVCHESPPGPPPLWGKLSGPWSKGCGPTAGWWTACDCAWPPEHCRGLVEAFRSLDMMEDLRYPGENPREVCHAVPPDDSPVGADP